jgi:hypothetical protein
LRLRLGHRAPKRFRSRPPTIPKLKAVQEHVAVGEGACPQLGGASKGVVFRVVVFSVAEYNVLLGIALRLEQPRRRSSLVIRLLRGVVRRLYSTPELTRDFSLPRAVRER